MDNSTFGFERPEDSPGFLLWQTTLSWQRLIKRALEEYDITHPQFVIMAVLMWFAEQKTEATQVMVARLSNLDKMTVSNSIRLLVAAGYLTRAEHVVDTRAKTVTLTKKGTALIKKLVPIVESIDTKFFGVLTKSDQKKLIQIFNTIHSQANHE